MAGLGATSSRTATAGSTLAARRPTTREREVLALLATGATDGEIADVLGLSPATVQTHVRNAKTKLGARTRAQAVALAPPGSRGGWGRGRPGAALGLLARHSDGVIALTGCLQSRFCQRLADGRPADARAHADDLVQVFGPEDVY